MTDVSLLPDITTLQEIVVAGYGAQKRANADFWIAIILFVYVTKAASPAGYPQSFYRNGLRSIHKLLPET